MQVDGKVHIRSHQHHPTPYFLQHGHVRPSGRPRCSMHLDGINGSNVEGYETR